MKPSLPAAVVLLCLAPPPPEAHANVGLIRDPAKWSGPDAVAPSTLAVDRERLTISCAPDAAREPRCRFEATYELANPGAEAERAVAAFYGRRVSEVTVTIDGAPAARPLTGEERALLDERVAEATGRRSSFGTGADEQTIGFELAAEPGQRRTLVAAGRIDPGPHGLTSYARSAAAARHLATDDGRRIHGYLLEYLLAPIRTFSQVGPITIEVTVPASWDTQLRFSGAPDAAASPPAWTVARDGANAVHRAEISATAGDELTMEISIPPETFRWGGPILGIGGAWGDGGGFRVRAGWEFAGPDWLMYGVSADTNFGDFWVVTPAVTFASPMVLIIPSGGLTFGVPVRVAPDVSVGARAEIDLMFGPVGICFGLDVYPADPGVQANLLGKLSL